PPRHRAERSSNTWQLNDLAERAGLLQMSPGGYSSGDRLELFLAERPRHDGDGHGECARMSRGNRGYQGPRPLGAFARGKHQDRDILVRLDQIADLLRALA